MGEPKIGDIYKNSIDINKNIKILLPQGVWEVNNIGEYKGELTWHAPWHLITLTNLDKNSRLKFVYYNYFKINSNWNGWDTPCDNTKRYPGINVVENNKIGMLEKCSFIFYWDDSGRTIALLKSNKFW